MKIFFNFMVFSLTLLILALIFGCASNPAFAPVVPANASPTVTGSPEETPTYDLSTHPVTETPIIVTQVLQNTPTVLTEPKLTKRPTAILPAGVAEYVRVVLALMDEHALDAYQAQKLEALTDENQIDAFRERAVRRLETIRGLQPHPDLQDAHNQVIASFELLISAWDSIKTKDYTAAKEILIRSYEPLVDAIVIFSDYLYP